MTETELINGCINADRACQNKLYKLFAAKMLTVCLRYSRNNEDAEDTLTEGFMKAFRNISSYRHEGSLEGWIRKIMVNTAINKFKSNQQLYRIISLEDYKNSISSDEDIVSDLRAKELIEYIRQLPPTYQMIFNLYSFEGMKHREIAEQLNISEGTSKSNLSDARTILKRKIESEQRISLALTAS